MIYKQSVVINSDFNSVKNSFSELTFLQYLIKLQPVKLVRWDGIKTGDIAHMKIWFLGWKDFIVKHQFHKQNNIILSFTDSNLFLPLGLTFWNHYHEVNNNNNIVTIIDDIEFKHKFKIVEYILYLPMILPILMRKILYKTYFKKYKP